jgi:RimJ/RimL family protein N-acetyltransferase
MSAQHTPSTADPASGLPVGPLVPAHAAPPPQRVTIEGRWCRLEPLDPARHGDDLFRISTVPDAPAKFAYLGTAPPTSRAAFDDWITERATTTAAVYHAVIDLRTGRAEGRQSLMRIDPANRVIEIGDIYWGPVIAGSRISTEAHFLAMRHCFDDLGYRRFEWKCNALNAPSRRAAARFGYTYEGTFRRHMIVKGRTRDTAWFSIIEEDWPAIREGTGAWLAPDNFDVDGRQKRSLVEFFAAAR